jgi:hypothetical protein
MAAWVDNREPPVHEQGVCMAEMQDVIDAHAIDEIFSQRKGINLETLVAADAMSAGVRDPPVGLVRL